MEIREVTAPGTLSIQLDILKPFKSSSTASFTLTPSDGGTHVTWSMVGRTTFVLKVMGVFTSMDKLIGPDFETGLGRLKAVAEHAS